MRLSESGCVREFRIINCDVAEFCHTRRHIKGGWNITEPEMCVGQNPSYLYIYEKWISNGMLCKSQCKHFQMDSILLSQFANGNGKIFAFLSYLMNQWFIFYSLIFWQDKNN